MKGYIYFFGNFLQTTVALCLSLVFVRQHTIRKKIVQLDKLRECCFEVLWVAPCHTKIL